MANDYAEMSESTTGGLLPAQRLRALIAQGAISGGPDAAQIQPASLDLRLGQVAYRVRASFLPGPAATVAEKLDAFAMHRFDLSQGAVLETGCVYIVPLLEGLALPNALSAAANPKSSTGRLDVFTRVIADRAEAFDQIAAGYRGPLYAEICPQTFPVLVRTGSRLAQIRFREGTPSAPPLTGESGIALSVDLEGAESGGMLGYRAKRHTAVVDVDAPGSCAVRDFWEPIRADANRRLILDPDQFYILASKEAVEVMPGEAAEMVPFNPLVGEFRVHYAGFFDPGFGHGAPSRAVLEVRSHKVPFILEHGQIIGRLVYEKLTETPDTLYGQGIGSHYQAQGLKLSKHFRAD
jgi:dCTP deaminase